MRAIVSLLKVFVGGIFLICTLSLAFVVGGSLVGFTLGGTGSMFGLLHILIAIAVFVVLVLYVGIVALLISGHDRLNEIVGLLAERNDLLRSGHSAAD